MIATNLVIQGSHLPATFKGAPDGFFAAMVERMKIVSPNGTAFFVVSDTEPSSNQGPWLKGGTQWWVFDNATKRYVPIDISNTGTKWFQVGSTVPATPEPPVWLKTANGVTEALPLEGTPISWNVWDGSSWIDFTSLKDKSVTFEKIADGLPGALITYEADSRPTLLLLGSADQLLQVSSDGQQIEWGALQPESLVGQLSAQVLGPLTDPTGYHILTQSVTITLAEAREVLIHAYANVKVATSADTTTVTLLIDGIARDSLLRGTALAADSSIGTVPLIARLTLSSGAHILTVDLAPGGGASDIRFVETAINNGRLPVKFLAELL